MDSAKHSALGNQIVCQSDFSIDEIGDRNCQDGQPKYTPHRQVTNRVTARLPSSEDDQVASCEDQTATGDGEDPKPSQESWPEHQLRFLSCVGVTSRGGVRRRLRQAVPRARGIRFLVRNSRGGSSLTAASGLGAVEPGIRLVACSHGPATETALGAGARALRRACGQDGARARCVLRIATLASERRERHCEDCAATRTRVSQVALMPARAILLDEGAQERNK
jgi:hypothetical protein